MLVLSAFDRGQKTDKVYIKLLNHLLSCTRILGHQEAGMATHNQYLFFQHLYDEERNRSESLVSRCNTLLVLVSIYGGVFALKDDSYVSAYSQLAWPYGLGLAFLLLAVLSGVFVYFLRTYDAIIDPAAWIKESFPDELPSDNEFFHYIIADVAKATRHNRRQNKWRANFFQAAVIFAFAGLAMHGIVRLSTLYFFGDPP